MIGYKVIEQSKCITKLYEFCFLTKFNCQSIKTNKHDKWFKMSQNATKTQFETQKREDQCIVMNEHYEKIVNLIYCYADFFVENL